MTDMKRLLSIVLAFILVFSMAACRSAQEPLNPPGSDGPSKPTAKEPPALKVQDNLGNSVEAVRGTYSWMYDIGNGIWTGVEADSAQRLEKYTERLYAKLKVLLEDQNVEESRVLTEAAIFADKTAVDEETVRLRSHIRQYRDILTEGGAVGRKLDFLTQELNRETNTIGSKCQDIEITRLVVDMKAEIEKIREQIQNIE